MASNIMKENGHEPTPELCEGDVKIVVVGEPRCGKSSFIEVFHNDHRLGDHYPEDCARVYPCKYDIHTEMKTVRIYEVLGGPDEDVEQLTKVHWDANGFVLMYAIDDPSSFQQVEHKWFPILNKGNMWNDNEPAIAVGTKRDRRNDPQVIQRLANNNQAPVTEQEGESLRLRIPKIRKYFDCSSTEPHNVGDAFHYILTMALTE